MVGRIFSGSVFNHRRCRNSFGKTLQISGNFHPAANLYGKYVVRMRAAKASGMISNFFLWKDGSEMSGVFWEEVDVEVFGKIMLPPGRATSSPARAPAPHPSRYTTTAPHSATVTTLLP